MKFKNKKKRIKAEITKSKLKSPIMPKRNLYLILGIIVFIAILFVIYFFFFRTINCLDEKCFRNNWEKCKRVYWESDEWGYRVIGVKADTCEVIVKNLGLKKGDAETIGKLKGKEMTCRVPLTQLNLLPHQNIDWCTGPLKEAILEVMLQKVHAYIVQHLREFNMTL